MPAIDSHFDVPALLQQVHAQPIGLEVSTNNPEGFRRLVYLHARELPELQVRIMQSPHSPNAFWLVKEGFKLEEADASQL